MIQYDVVIIGAGAAGLMCAIEAGKRGRRVCVIEHSKKIGEKIRISGGGKCNFTNMDINPKCYLSQNPHFMKSALKQFTQWDFLDMIARHNIAYFEKTLGQLFCENSANDIIDMLLQECNTKNVDILMETSVNTIARTSDSFTIKTDSKNYIAQSLVIATGGLSIPKIGATSFGYTIAKQFNIPVVKTCPALVPLTFDETDKATMQQLSGVSVNAIVSTEKQAFQEGMLFTHLGLSGPSILQISSYINDGEPLYINLSPDTDIVNFLKTQKQRTPKKRIDTVLKTILPNRLVDLILEQNDYNQTLADAPYSVLENIGTIINAWYVVPNGCEGYRTAEVTLGGIDTHALSSKTMECTHVKGLYFIGEVVDVTGWLGGYNFQWAWSSGYACGQQC